MGLPFILVAGILIYSYANQAKAAYNQIQYTPTEITKFDLGFFSSSINFIFSVENNTNTSLTINSIDGLLYADGTQFGTFNIFKPFTIPPSGKVNVAATIKITNLTTATLIYKTIIGGKTPLIVFDGGFTTTLLGRIPFKYNAFLSQDLKFIKAKKANPAPVVGIGAAKQKVYNHFTDKYGNNYGFTNYADFAKFWFNIPRRHAINYFPNFKALQNAAANSKEARKKLILK